MRSGHIITLAFSFFCLLSCQNGAEPPKTENPPEPKLPPKRATDRKGNTDGAVFVLMYHRITENAGGYDRTPAGFRQDLERLYGLGFRPVTLSDYVSGSMDLPPGASPVILTFDDSDSTQFKFQNDGSIDPSTAVGIWQTFAKEHNDFPVRGSFFVLPNGPFGKDGDKKVQQLLGWGCDVGSHTLHHKRLDRMSDDEVRAELAGAVDWLQSIGVTRPGLLALPFGIRPKNHELLNSFFWKGKEYKNDAALMVGAGPARAPGDPKRDLEAIPRIQATEADLGITYWLDKVEAGKVELYVEP